DVGHGLQARGNGIAERPDWPAETLRGEEDLPVCQAGVPPVGSGRDLQRGHHRPCDGATTWRATARRGHAKWKAPSTASSADSHPSAVPGAKEASAGAAFEP